MSHYSTAIWVKHETCWLLLTTIYKGRMFSKAAGTKVWFTRSPRLRKYRCDGQCDLLWIRFLFV